MKFMVEQPDRVLSDGLGGMGWLKEGSFEQRIFVRMGDRATFKNPVGVSAPVAKLAITAEDVRIIAVPVKVHDRDRVGGCMSGRFTRFGLTGASW